MNVILSTRVTLLQHIIQDIYGDTHCLPYELCLVVKGADGKLPKRDRNPFWMSMS